ncbi:MAG: hypothetical protein ACTSU5_16435 [Promethearchaeota archaeon]
MAYPPQNPNDQQINNQMAQIQANLDGTMAQIGAMQQQIDQMSRDIMESFYQLTENLRLILRVLKEQRVNFTEGIQTLADEINISVKQLFEKKAIEAITSDQVKAVQAIKEMSKLTSDNLYNMQLLTIIQSLREIIGRAIAAKMKKVST